MIIGIGTDIVVTSRLLAIAERAGRHVFTAKEHTYCRSKYNPDQHYAGFWAAKEAFRKASGYLTQAMVDIEITHDESGCPMLRLHSIQRPLGFKTHVSISHDGEYAVATVIIERN